MREDMSKVIVERPRINRGYGPKGGRDKQLSHDLMPSKEGMKKPYLRGYNNKQLNENLSPLRRFLEGCVGRKWDDVYSEISKNLRPDNAVQQHVRDHVDDFVARRVTTIGKDGKLYISRRYWGGLQPLEESHISLYVDPQDGVLKRNTPAKNYYQQQRERRRRELAEKASKERDLPDGTVLRKMEGIWYEILHRPIPPIVVKQIPREDGTFYEQKSGGSAWDILERDFVSLGGVYRGWRRGRYHSSNSKPRTHYAYGKRQLSKEELRKHGLSND